jgi:hypothetical protein
MELSEFIKTEPERLLRSTVAKMMRKRLGEAWLLLRQDAAH